MPEEAVVWEPIEVDNLLIEMGLDRVGLEHSVRVAEHEKSFVTDNDPVGFANYLVYAKAARTLREVYLRKGWQKDDSNNQAAIKNPDLMIRVVPCNFNEFAGNKNFIPSNKAPKGEVSRKKSACNMSAWLPGLEPPVIAPELNDGYVTWLLGIHIDELRPTGAELSFPIEFDGRHFKKFGTRIVLFAGTGDDGSRERKPNDDDALEIVEIAIKRK